SQTRQSLCILFDDETSPPRLHSLSLHDALPISHDKAMFKYYTTGQLAVVDAANGSTRVIGAPGMIRSVDASPDGRYFRVTRTVRSEEHTSELQSRENLVCRLLLEKKKKENKQQK